MGAVLASQVNEAAISGGVTGIGGVISLIIFIYMAYDVSRSNAGIGKKVIWIVLSFFFSIIPLIVWLVWGKRNANKG
jgi:hypothetical protein